MNAQERQRNKVEENSWLFLAVGQKEMREGIEVRRHRAAEMERKNDELF